MPAKDFLPQKGAYRNLIAYQKAECVYDATFLFTRKFLSVGDVASGAFREAEYCRGLRSKDNVVRNRAKATECSKGQFTGVIG